MEDVVAIDRQRAGRRDIDSGSSCGAGNTDTTLIILYRQITGLVIHRPRDSQIGDRTDGTSSANIGSPITCRVIIEADRYLIGPTSRGRTKPLTVQVVAAWGERQVLIIDNRRPLVRKDHRVADDHTERCRVLDIDLSRVVGK